VIYLSEKQRVKSYKEVEKVIFCGKSSQCDLLL